MNGAGVVMVNVKNMDEKNKTQSITLIPGTNGEMGQESDRYGQAEEK